MLLFNFFYKTKLQFNNVERSLYYCTLRELCSERVRTIAQKTFFRITSKLNKGEKLRLKNHSVRGKEI